MRDSLEDVRRELGTLAQHLAYSDEVVLGGAVFAAIDTITAVLKSDLPDGPKQDLRRVRSHLHDYLRLTRHGRAKAARESVNAACAIVIPD